MTLEPVRYTISMLHANAHNMEITMKLQVLDSSKEELRLAMPVWTPGYYRVEDFSRNVNRVKAFDQESGKELRVQKLEKSLWLVATGGANAVRIEYAVYAFTYRFYGSYVDDKHALINGAGVFLYAEGMQGTPVRLKLEPRSNWKFVSTGLTRVSDWEFEAPNYDMLVDSPIEIGNQEVEKFRTARAEYEVSMFGQPLADNKSFVEDIRKVVQATERVFGQVPFKRYVFIINFTDVASGGLEHLNSTFCLLPRFKMIPAEEYHRAMVQFSHEFFHAWNVKRMKPAGLGPFDYSRETYTKSLWIAEGLTNYYDNLILRRAGIYSVEEYLDAFADSIDVMKSLPGRKHQSAEEASFDAWTKNLYKLNENTSNVTLSYYTQGAVIGWMLDMVLRNGGKGTLDDVMKQVYTSSFLEGKRGYTDEEFERACVSLGGAAVKEIFDSRVRGREDVDFDRYLRFAGLRLEPKTKVSGRGFLGVRLNSERGGTMVREVLAGSPAEAIGLSVNDEVIGLDGLRTNQERFSFYIGAANPGKEVRLTIARNGRLDEVQGRVGIRPTFEWRVQPLAGATEKQKKLFKDWMRADWKAELNYPEYTKSPDRLADFEYV